jgi:hypothetical protein
VLGTEDDECACGAAADGAVLDERVRVGSFALEAGAETVFQGN